MFVGGIYMDMVQHKIAHLKGLAEGLDVFAGKDGKVYTEIIDIISNLDENIQHIHNRLLDLEEYVDVIDEDLNEIENEYYEGDVEEDYDDLTIEDDDFRIGIDSEDTDLEATDNDFFQITCPNCEETVIVDYEIFEDNEVEKINCPNCENQIIINIDVPSEE